jgi:class 3 adenylate cyclase
MELAEPWPLPANPALASIVSEFEALHSCATFFDAEWFYVYGTREYAELGNPLLPSEPPHHWFGPEITAAMRHKLGPDHSRDREFLATGSWALFDTPGGRDVLRRRVDVSLVDLVDLLDPAPPPAMVVLSHLDVIGIEALYGGVRSDMRIVMLRLHDSSGEHVGWVREFRPTARATQVFSALALADLRHLDRMTAVTRPDRRPAAVLFADLEASSPLAKRVSTSQYFAFARRMVRAVDQCLIDHGGIVGRHAGDGVTGFFLAETAGSESAAARSCIEAARALRGVLSEVVKRSDLQEETVTLRFGLHWGARLYVGHILTAGRSEVTALGDDVNDAARIEACASGGRTLASKDLIECLTHEDADALGIDLSHAKYTVLAELPTATDKARRDAPAIAVCDV